MEEFEREVFIPSKKTQVLTSIVLGFAAYSVGTVVAWTAPAIPDLEATEHFGVLTVSDKSWIASIVTLAALIAGPITGFAIDKIGRRKTAIAIGYPFFVSWLMVAFAPNVPILIFARFALGLCVGASSLTVPVFIAEITDETVRGALCNLFPLGITFGIMNTYIFGSFMTWFQLTIVNAAVTFVYLVLAHKLPESPVFLISKGQYEKARLSLKWLRGAMLSDQIEPEIQQLRRAIDEKREVRLSAKEFFSPPVLKPNIICVSLMFFQQMSGINAVIFYTVEIFETSGSNINPNLSSVIVGLVLMISVIISILLIDRAGRKILLIVSDIGMSIALFGLGLYFYLKDEGSDPSLVESLTWLPLASLMLFVTSFNFGFGTVPWLYNGELLPSHVKGLGSGIAVAHNWLIAFLVTKSFEDFIFYMGKYGCYWMFSIVCAVGTVFCVLFVPETKGKTLEEIQNIFRG
ncbi:unnamed protein product [Orchesella dallaii]|uniref:Major facilitator superfamily (MFS) profile domain-containing protein n=1 Tax=Orchesella dallaii TaxID=48710 RepID=A0ABP1QHR1_9HEXA